MGVRWLRLIIRAIVWVTTLLFSLIYLAKEHSFAPLHTWKRLYWDIVIAVFLMYILYCREKKATTIHFGPYDELFFANISLNKIWISMTLPQLV